MNMIKQLIKIANSLDKKGYYEIASEVDNIIAQAADSFVGPPDPNVQSSQHQQLKYEYDQQLAKFVREVYDESFKISNQFWDLVRGSKNKENMKEVTKKNWPYGTDPTGIELNPPVWHSDTGFTSPVKGVMAPDNFFDLGNGLLRGIDAINKAKLPALLKKLYLPWLKQKAMAALSKYQEYIRERDSI